MKLYHGGLTAVNSPRIIRSEIGRDFGFAFYTTDIKEQAERWAYRRQRAAIRNGCSSAQAIVSVFEFDEAASRKNLEFLDFPEANLAWLDLVVACRSDCTFTHQMCRLILLEQIYRSYMIQNNMPYHNLLNSNILTLDR